MPALFVRVKKDFLSFRRQVQFGGLRYPVAKNDTLFDIPADCIDSKICSKGEEARRDGLVFAHQSEQDMLRRNGWRAILQCFVACEKNDPTRAFRIAFEHKITAQAFALL